MKYSSKKKKIDNYWALSFLIDCFNCFGPMKRLEASPLVTMIKISPTLVDRADSKDSIFYSF